MPLKEIKKILVISLSNIGDVILTFPVIDILREDFPESSISIVIGPKAESLLKGNPNFEKIYIFNKRQPLSKTIPWILELRRQKYDLVIDLRNTAIPFLIGGRKSTSSFVKKNNAEHMKNKHLNRLRSVYPQAKETAQKVCVFASDDVKTRIAKMVEEKIGKDKKFFIIAPGAADSAKRFREEGFAKIADQVIKDYRLPVVFVGDTEDQSVAQRILLKGNSEGMNLCGETTLLELAQLIKLSEFVITNDSSPMHLASYLNVPVFALFGPTDPAKYGPWSRASFVIPMSEVSEKDISDRLKDFHERI